MTSSVFIKGELVNVGDGADEILRLRALLDKRNKTIRELKQRVEELVSLTEELRSELIELQDQSVEHVDDDFYPIY